MTKGGEGSRIQAAEGRPFKCMIPQEPEARMNLMSLHSIIEKEIPINKFQITKKSQ